MTRRAGSADLPLHGGRVPAWLGQRMTRLGAVIVFLADVEFAAEDGLDSLLFCCVEEMHRTIDVAVVGHRDSGLSQGVDMLDQLF